MKILRALLPAAIFCAPAAHAREGPYELLGRALTPFLQVLAKESSQPIRAVTMKLRLEAMTDLSPELAGAFAEIAIEAPDKLRVHAPLLGEKLTIIRNGQQLWIAPGAKAAKLIAAAESAGRLPKADRKFQLAPFSVPFPEKQFVLLPALFQARLVGGESLDGEPCRVVDFTLMPELARSLKMTGWAARIWVKQDGAPLRLTVAREKWMITVRFEELRFEPALPADTFQPAEEDGAHPLPPRRYKQLIDLLTGMR